MDNFKEVSALKKIKQLSELYFQNPDLPQRDANKIMCTINMIVNETLTEVLQGGKDDDSRRTHNYSDNR